MIRRHSIAALAHPRAQWPATVARWADGGGLPVELLTCLSPDELTAALASGRRISAVLLDGASGRVEEQLVAEIRRCGAEPVGVEALDVSADWDRLGISSILHAEFDREDLVGLLDTACSVEQPSDRAVHGVTLSTTARNAAVVTVCGSGGCGTSVVAMALAQGFAGTAGGLVDPTDEGTEARVLLIDLARRAHQAMYHHTGDVIPGLVDLIGKVRRGTTDGAEIQATTFGTGRGYRLLLGAPTLRESASLGSTMISEALVAAAHHNDIVVVDHDGDQPEGHTREVLGEAASLWVIVVGPGIKGLHDAVRLTAEACGSGVAARQILVTCNRVRRRDPQRIAFPVEFSRITRGMGIDIAPVLMLPEVRLEAVHRDVAPLPRNITRPLINRASRLLDAAASLRNHREQQLLAASAP